ncbi:(d)CMP kinase [Patescibacteria group bacterium]|nr:(d)CMP kinase [Patescibacteria group bacterium]MBU1931299.1 (d)CMP kinase [Patescibacteria group bacterium]
MGLKKNLQIAIDGPLAAGKGTVAYLLAKKLEILYVDTGAMYRAAALLGLRHGLDLKKEAPLVKLLKQAKIELKIPEKNDGRFCTALLNGEDVTWKIRDPRVSWGSSQVGTFPQARKHLVALQKKIAQAQVVVMEGRDITTVVLPKADLKVYMTANPTIRAKRRWRQLQQVGKKDSFKKVLSEAKKRDYQDKHKGGLKLAKDAWILNTTKLTIDQVVAKILAKLRSRGLLTD